MSLATVGWSIQKRYGLATIRMHDARLFERVSTAYFRAP